MKRASAATPGEPERREAVAERLLRQGWISIAFWMSFGLLLEGLLGYKVPAYLSDPQRRELFRLAHTHGTLLGVFLILAALVIAQGSQVAQPAVRALRIGAALMPLGFLLSGIWHPESDPGMAIWLVPPGALLVIYATISFALAQFGAGRN
jgi:hypothetical protein